MCENALCKIVTGLAREVAGRVHRAVLDELPQRRRQRLRDGAVVRQREERAPRGLSENRREPSERVSPTL